MIEGIINLIVFIVGVGVGMGGTLFVQGLHALQDDEDYAANDDDQLYRTYAGGSADHFPPQVRNDD